MRCAIATKLRTQRLLIHILCEAQKFSDYSIFPQYKRKMTHTNESKYIFHYILINHTSKI